MVVIFFSLLASNCSQQKGPTNEASKTLLMSSPENWLNESKARRAKLGERSRGTPQCGCGARGWARVGAEEGDSHPPLVENNPGSNFWSSACAEAWGGGARDQGSPSRFLWLFLGRSFDLFLTKTAETQGIGSLAMRGAWQRPGDGRPRGSGARPGSSSHQRQRQAGM